MKIIEPITVLPTMLTSNVPETEAGATVWAAGPYAIKSLVIRNHHVYEALAAATSTDIPGAETVVPFKWLDKGPTNPWRMFAKDAMQLIPNSTPSGAQQAVYLIGTKTTNFNNIQVTIVPGVVTNAIALFGLVGNKLEIIMTDPVEGIIYNKVIDLVDYAAYNMWEWLFKPLSYVGNLAILDLPSYGSATIMIKITAAPGTNAECSMLTLGQLNNLGLSCFGTDIGITDFSVKKQDDFGNEFVLERGFRDRVRYDVRLNTSDVYRVKQVLTKLRAKGAVYIGDEKRQETILFGRYKDLQIVLSSHSISECVLDVGSLN